MRSGRLRIRRSAQVAVVTSFYPIQFAIQQVGGDHVPVTILTKPGAEPHDLELARRTSRGGQGGPRRLRQGLPAGRRRPPSTRRSRTVLDVAPVAKLDLDRARPARGGGATAHTAARRTPPRRQGPALLARPPALRRRRDQAIGARLGEADPANAATYAKNTTAFIDKLCDARRRAPHGPRVVPRKELVTSHAAFGYLASATASTSAASPASPPTPSPARAASAGRGLRQAHGVTTIYQETLVEPHFAETVAGARARGRDARPDRGDDQRVRRHDYLEVMRTNLATLQGRPGLLMRSAPLPADAASTDERRRPARARRSATANAPSVTRRRP